MWKQERNQFKGISKCAHIDGEMGEREAEEEDEMK